MKYFSYLVRKPKLSSNLYETNMNALKLLIKNRNNEPQNLFEDKMVELLFDNHPKKTSIKEGDIEYLSEENMLEVFSKKFKNFDGYTGIVVGSIKEKDIIPILEKYFASLPTDIPRESEEITIISDKQSLNEAMKYFSYLVRKPKLSSNLYETNMNALKLLIKNRDNEPQNLFEDKMVELLFDNHPKKTSIKEGDIEYLSEENMLEVFSKKFKNFDGYTGIVVGSIKEKDIIPILEKYFASLPTDIPRESSWQDIGLEYPSDIVCGEVIKGNDKKILVDINYPIHKPFTPENKVLTSAVAKIMRITFVEEIREKISGVYGISVSPRFSKYEKGYLNIFFSTDPKKEKMVLDKLHFEINKILHGYINLKALDSIKENYKLSYENSF